MKKSVVIDYKDIISHITKELDEAKEKRKAIFQNGKAWYTEYAYYTGKIRAFQQLIDYLKNN